MALSPMMQHYIETKEQYSDCILFYRLGDFYEMFFEDAITVSRELELTLTGKDCGLKERAPMCGIPYHALNNYLPRLVEKGYKVAICEQLTDPKDSKGLVLRDVVRTVTPGTLIDEGFLQEDRNNFIAGLCLDNGAVGVAWSDISTGECNYTYFEGQTHAALNDLLSRIEPKEIICNEAMAVESINLSVVRFCKVCPFTLYNESAFDLQNAGVVASEKLPKEVFEKMFTEDIDVEKFVEDNGLRTVNDESALRETVEQVIADNPQSVADYQAGKTKAIGFLVGQTMKAMRGKADPGLVNKILRELL